jgi:hypothetical protein
LLYAAFLLYDGDGRGRVTYRQPPYPQLPPTEAVQSWPDGTAATRAPEPAPSIDATTTTNGSGPVGIQPIGTLTGYPRPMMWSELLETSKLVEVTTRTLGSSDVAMSNRALAGLAGQAARHPKSKRDRATDANVFVGFMHDATQADEARLQAWMEELRVRLEAQPYDAEPTCEWGWLALLSNQRKYAEDAFLRAIWAQPGHPCGWYGLGAAAEQDSVRYGALTMVQTLYTAADPDLQVELQGFTRTALARIGEDGARFRLLLARGQRNSLVMHRKPVPEAVATIAGQPLPPPQR